MTYEPAHQPDDEVLLREELEGSCRDEWPLTLCVRDTQDQAEIEKSFHPDGEMVYRVCRSEHGWELVTMPAEWAEAHGV